MTPKQFLAKFKETVRAGNSTLRRLVFRRLYATDEFFETRSTLVRNWVHFNFARALRIPVRIVNDAAMQALGSYLGDGRMLFLGLGTGLGSALVWDRNLMSLELGDLPYPNGKSLKTISVSLASRNWARENGNAKSFMRSAN